MSERVEQARREIERIERAMLEVPLAIEPLRAEREVALAALAEAEVAALAEREENVMVTTADIRKLTDEIAAARAAGEGEPHDPASREVAARSRRLDLLEAAVDEIREKLDQIAANTRPPGPRRSMMTPAAKSRYIREHGKQKYDAIPW